MAREVAETTIRFWSVEKSFQSTLWPFHWVAVGSLANLHSIYTVVPRGLTPRFQQGMIASESFLAGTFVSFICSSKNSSSNVVPLLAC